MKIRTNSSPCPKIKKYQRPKVYKLDVFVEGTNRLNLIADVCNNTLDVEITGRPLEQAHKNLYQIVLLSLDSKQDAKLVEEFILGFISGLEHGLEITPEDLEDA